MHLVETLRENTDVLGLFEVKVFSALISYT